jgi:hypothetical protein
MSESMWLLPALYPIVLILFFCIVFAFVTELYLRTWLGCGPTEEGSGNGSIVV